VAIVGGATIQRSTLVSSLTPKLITGFGVKKVAAYTAAHAATATTQSPLPESLGGLLDAGEQRLVAAKVAGIGAQTWAALLAALRAHFGGGGGGSGGRVATAAMTAVLMAALQPSPAPTAAARR
jgi:hypothetical protein